jgi:glycosyltransferase involved in cell wall biosynthesis
MITVAHIITKLELGGAQENTLYTCEHLDRSRFRVALLYGPGGLLDARAQGMRNVQTEAISSLVREIDPVKDGRALFDLRRALKRLYQEHRSSGGQSKAFIVHTHSSKAGVLGRAAARAARAPVVIHTIHGFGFHDGQAPLQFASFLGAERAMSKLTDAFIAVSRANLAEASARGIVSPRHEVAVIRSGFELEPFLEINDETRTRAREHLGLTDRDEVVLCIGNLKAQKDPLTLVRAAAELRGRRPDVQFLYAGDGELRARVEREIATLGLGTHFRLLGWRTDVPALMAAADVISLASLFEGLPRSAVQALAAQRPFVGTRVDGTSEIIRNGQNGFLVEPRAPRALADALDRALRERPTTPEDRERVRMWDAATMVREEEVFYRKLVERID